MIIFRTESKQTRGGSRTSRSSMMELFVTMEVISYWQSSSNLDDGRMLELLLYAIIFNFHDKTGNMGEDKDLEDWIISDTGTLFLFLVQGISFIASSAEKWLFFDRSICILVFYKVLFESIPLFWKYWIKLKGCSKPGNLSFRNIKSF